MTVRMKVPGVMPCGMIQKKFSDAQTLSAPRTNDNPR
jgi:hypothetical protein